jgi:hypothetical protein
MALVVSGLCSGSGLRPTDWSKEVEERMMDFGEWMGCPRIS